MLAVEACEVHSICPVHRVIKEGPRKRRLIEFEDEEKLSEPGLNVWVPAKWGSVD